MLLSTRNSPLAGIVKSSCELLSVKQLVLMFDKYSVMSSEELQTIFFIVEHKKAYWPTA
ncbi:MAG: hypothetical protein K2L48_04690 [Mycoplasmoidaceae bacterium]|nr:hypothetical protein [Mycoplasmoidaceae bacterium]